MNPDDDDYGACNCKRCERGRVIVSFSTLWPDLVRHRCDTCGAGDYLPREDRPCPS